MRITSATTTPPRRPSTASSSSAQPHALHLLKLSRADLDHEILEKLQSNPLLEIDGLEDFTVADTYPLQEAFLNDSPQENSRFDIFEYPQLEAYRSQLLNQVYTAHFSEREQHIALALIDAIDEHGFLKTPLCEICNNLEPILKNMTPQEVEHILVKIQDFEPAGVGARDVREYLLLQLKALTTHFPYRAKTQRMIEAHFDLLVAHRHSELRKIYQLSKIQFQEILEHLKTLKTDLFDSFPSLENLIPLPDLKIHKDEKHAWHVTFLETPLSKVHLHAEYQKHLEEGNKNSGARCHPLEKKLQEARWFLKSLTSRKNTLLTVTRFIVEHQKDFFERGELGMKSLTLKNIAQATGLHESTISRVIANKFVMTPRGIFSLKFFFTHPLHNETPASWCHVTVCAQIKKMIDKEDKQHPLSDDAITQQLHRMDIPISRRTVAKYREHMTIPASYQRRAYAI